MPSQEEERHDEGVLAGVEVVAVAPADDLKAKFNQMFKGSPGVTPTSKDKEPKAPPDAKKPAPEAGKKPPGGGS